jgi:hypothetical protein
VKNLLLHRAPVRLQPPLRATSPLISDLILRDKMQSVDPIPRARETDLISRAKVERDALINRAKAAKDGPILPDLRASEDPILPDLTESEDPIHHAKVVPILPERTDPILPDLTESEDPIHHVKAVPILQERTGPILLEQMVVLEDLILQDLKDTRNSNARFLQRQMASSEKLAKRAFLLLKNLEKSDSGTKRTATSKHRRRLSIPRALLTRAIDRACAPNPKTKCGAKNAHKNTAWSFRKRSFAPKTSACACRSRLKISLQK